MGKRVTRQELYELVWSEPMSKLAATFGISGVALAKASDRMAVPVPPRGYWARKAAGKSDERTALPKRPPGLDDETVIGGGPYWRYNLSQISPDELLRPIPPMPVWDETLEDVRIRVEAEMRKVAVPKTLGQPHAVVAKLLKEDEDRKAKGAGLSYMATWYAPRYESPIQRRRLRLLSAIFVATAACDCRASAWGGKPHDGPTDEFAVLVGDQNVRLRVAVVESKHRTGRGTESKTTVEEKIRITLNPGDRGDAGGPAWEDGEARLEQKVREIALAIIVRGEEQHREGRLYQHRWRIQAKADLIERRRKEQEEADRKARERRAELERQRVDRLLGEAESLRKATAIRQYVQEARSANCQLPDPMPETEMKAWADWVLAQADRIDPVRNGSFRKPFTGDE